MMVSTDTQMTAMPPRNIYVRSELSVFNKAGFRAIAHTLMPAEMPELAKKSRMPSDKDGFPPFTILSKT